MAVSCGSCFFLNITCNTADSVPDGPCWFILNPDAVPTENMSFGTLKALYL